LNGVLKVGHCRRISGVENAVSQVDHTKTTQNSAGQSAGVGFSTNTLTSAAPFRKDASQLLLLLTQRQRRVNPHESAQFRVYIFFVSHRGWLPLRLHDFPNLLPHLLYFLFTSSRSASASLRDSPITPPRG
jgi:hypothetical protein